MSGYHVKKKTSSFLGVTFYSLHCLPHLLIRISCVVGFPPIWQMKTTDALRGYVTC